MTHADGPASPDDQITQRDAAALDALVNAGFDLARVPAEIQPDAKHVARVLGLLDVSPITGGKELRVERTVSRLAEQRPHQFERLTDLSDAALESYVMAGFRPSRVPSVLGSRANTADRLGRALTAGSPETEDWIATTRSARINATIDAVEANDAPSYRFERFSGGRGSFRLADAIAAAAVLLLVSAVFVPALSAHRGSQRQAACLSGLSQTAQAFGMYAGDYRESLPMATAGFGGSWMDVGSTPERSNSANLFTLVRTGHAGVDDLACPGNERAPTLVLEPDALDWGSLEEVSYSYRIMPSPRSARVHVLSNRAIVVADRSPVVLRAAVGEPVSPEANSPNHGSEGQHVLRLDGVARWTESPVVAGDNIWLPRPIEQIIHSVRSRVGLVTGTELPSSNEDAFLGP
ncbi:MAG: hypothetical protein AAF297_06315 [Planctomycetota bacterium]